MPRRAVVAMSGGVDSSVAAALLVEAGWEVLGLSLRLWSCTADGPTGSCCGLGDLDAAAAVAGTLGIPHHVLDARAAFEAEVLRPCWDDYAAGRTPNPCVRCNRHLKFGLLLDRARLLGAERVATGHYARTALIDGHPALLRGVDRRKDQSYFLFDLPAGALPLLDFPCGGYTKDEVRALARDRGLPGADRAESQDACFVTAEGSFAEALRLHFGAPAQPGPIVDPTGRVLGRHAGLHRFTLGQRRGTDVALGHRAYVVDLRPDDGAVVLGSDQDGLLATGLTARDVTWLPGARPTGERSCLAQIRYRSPATAARVTPGPDDTISVALETPQRAVTPGQAVVLYDDDRVLGGGWISRTHLG